MEGKSSDIEMPMRSNVIMLSVVVPVQPLPLVGTHTGALTELEGSVQLTS